MVSVAYGSFKIIINAFLFRLLLRDSAYALSDVLFIRYPEDQARTDDNKCLFNVRHSQARVEMTKDIYGIVKRRFPLTKHMRVDFDNAINIIVTPATLHNIALDWADPMPQDDHPNPNQVPEAAQPPQQDYADVVLLNGLNPGQREIWRLLLVTITEQ